MKKLKIFLSSVQKEFAGERRFLRDFIVENPLLKKFFEVFIFEDTPASNRNPNEAYLKEVEQSDIFIALFGDQYGLENKMGLSPVHQEYARATELGKVRLVYVKGQSDVNRHPKMASLIKQAGTQIVRRRFDASSELAVMAYASLIDYLDQVSLLRTVPFDASFCQNASMKDIDPEKVKWFLGRAKRMRGYALDEDINIHDALTHLNLLVHEAPSNAAVLLFGNAPQRFLISSEIKCLHFHGTEFVKPIPSYQIYKGTLFDLADQAIDFVLSKLDRSVGTRANGPSAPVKYDIPEDVVAEAVINAIAHRDYTSNASVQVMLFSDRLEIWNPGCLPPPLTVSNLMKIHQSIPANPLIAEPLFLAKYIEKVGSGINDMVRACREAGLPVPEFRQEGGSFILTIRRAVRKVEKKQPESRTESSTSPVPVQYQSLEDRILTLLKQAELPIAVISGRLGQKRVSGQLKVVLKKILQENLIEYTIPGKPNSRLQKYRLTEKGMKLLKSLKFPKG